MNKKVFLTLMIFVLVIIVVAGLYVEYKKSSTSEVASSISDYTKTIDLSYGLNKNVLRYVFTSTKRIKGYTYTEDAKGIEAITMDTTAHPFLDPNKTNLRLALIPSDERAATNTQVSIFLEPTVNEYQNFIKGSENEFKSSLIELPLPTEPMKVGANSLASFYNAIIYQDLNNDGYFNREKDFSNTSPVIYLDEFKYVWNASLAGESAGWKFQKIDPITGSALDWSDSFSQGAITIPLIKGEKPIFSKEDGERLLERRNARNNY